MQKMDYFSGLSISFTFILLFSLGGFTSTVAYDALDPEGNITITWDVVSWNPDGYIASVRIYNFQKYRHIEAPGWKLIWTWAKKEIIWNMLGGEATEQGNCSSFKGDSLPHNCERSPTIVDLLPGAPYNQQSANCCRGGVLSSSVQDPANSVTSFKIVVGQAGTTISTVRLPKGFTLLAPGPGYTCGPAKMGKPNKFLTPDKRRTKQAIMTWNVTCTYSQFMAQKTPTCCVSLSAFYNNKIVGCPTCACGCQNNTQSLSCADSDPPRDVNTLTSPLLKCSSHMCPIRVHWHIKVSYKEYWRVKVAITNFNYGMNYTNWNLVIQHPNLQNLTQTLNVNYQPLTPYDPINDTALLWGLKFYNDMLLQSGPYGNVQGELLFKKDRRSFTFESGWAFPRTIYFNGDFCVMPPPDIYPHLPSHSTRPVTSVMTSFVIYYLYMLYCFV